MKLTISTRWCTCLFKNKKVSVPDHALIVALLLSVILSQSLNCNSPTVNADTAQPISISSICDHPVSVVAGNCRPVGTFVAMKRDSTRRDPMTNESVVKVLWEKNAGELAGFAVDIPAQSVLEDTLYFYLNSTENSTKIAILIESKYINGPLLMYKYILRANEWKQFRIDMQNLPSIMKKEDIQSISVVAKNESAGCFFVHGLIKAHGLDQIKNVNTTTQKAIDTLPIGPYSDETPLGVYSKSSITTGNARKIHIGNSSNPGTYNIQYHGVQSGIVLNYGDRGFDVSAVQHFNMRSLQNGRTFNCRFFDTHGNAIQFCFRLPDTLWHSIVLDTVSYLTLIDPTRIKGVAITNEDSALSGSFHIELHHDTIVNAERDTLKISPYINIASIGESAVTGTCTGNARKIYRGRHDGRDYVTIEFYGRQSGLVLDFMNSVDVSDGNIINIKSLKDTRIDITFTDTNFNSKSFSCPLQDTSWKQVHFDRQDFDFALFPNALKSIFLYGVNDHDSGAFNIEIRHTTETDTVKNELPIIPYDSTPSLGSQASYGGSLGNSRKIYGGKQNGNDYQTVEFKGKNAGFFMTFDSLVDVTTPRCLAVQSISGVSTFICRFVDNEDNGIEFPVTLINREWQKILISKENIGLKIHHDKINTAFLITGHETDSGVFNIEISRKTVSEEQESSALKIVPWNHLESIGTKISRSRINGNGRKSDKGSNGYYNYLRVEVIGDTTAFIMEFDSTMSIANGGHINFKLISTSFLDVQFIDSENNDKTYRIAAAREEWSTAVIEGSEFGLSLFTEKIKYVLFRGNGDTDTAVFDIECGN